MPTLTVGVGQQFDTIAAAVNAASNGDIVQVQSGVYTNDFLSFDKDITLQAINGEVKMIATVSPPDGKAMITESGNVTITGFDISGVSVRDNNGAAIRYQGGNLTLVDDYFHNNQDGMLTAADPNGTITINHSEFAFNGGGSGNTHNLYVGGLDRLTINNSYFHDASVGHEVKSRANNTTITNSRMIDNDSTSSYSVDLPNGGNATITNNVIEQGVNGQNNNIIAYGEEGLTNVGNNVTISDNTIVNDKDRGTLLLNPSNTSIALNNNTIFGLTSNQLGNGAIGNNSFTDVRPTFDTSSLSFDTTAPPPIVSPPVITPPVEQPPVANDPPPIVSSPVVETPPPEPIVTPPVVETPPPVVTPPIEHPQFSLQDFFGFVSAHMPEFQQAIPGFERIFAEWNTAFPFTHISLTSTNDF